MLAATASAGLRRAGGGSALVRAAVAARAGQRAEPAVSRVAAAARYFAAVGAAEPGGQCPAREVADANWRRSARVEGVTVVADAAGARRALQELRRLRHRPHAWDTETTDLSMGRGVRHQSPVTHGHIVCATCYCGDDADFGSGPRLYVDNLGPAEGLLKEYFKEYFEDDLYKKVFHNYAFDRHVFQRHGITLGGYHADTMHLARMYDTSLASWEGSAQAKMRHQAEGSPRGPAAAPQAQAQAAPVKQATVVGVKIGGRSLTSAMASSGSNAYSTLTDDSVMMPLDFPAPAKTTSRATGYGLKSLAQYFGLVDGRQQQFAERFGVHFSAAKDASESPERFPGFVEYSTTDAKLTYDLYEKLHKLLRDRPWFSAVHEKPISEALRSRDVAEQLLQKRKRTVSAQQHATGSSMWDLYEQYIRDLGVCLADLEARGVGVNRDRLQEIEQEIKADIDESSEQFVGCLSSVKGPDGKLLNPHAAYVNPQSHVQIRNLLFGGAQNTLTGESLEEVRVVAAPKDVDMPGPKSKRVFELHSLGLTPGTAMKDISPAGWPKTSYDVLQKLVGKSDSTEGDVFRQLRRKGWAEEDAEQAVRAVTGLGELSRLKRTLANAVRPLQEHASASGRVHASWKFDTATGRLACSSPNLQNVPRAAQDKYKIRGALRPGPGNVFVISDYAQLELNILAHMANCSGMIEKLRLGGDYHSEVAAEMFPHVQAALDAGEVVMTAGQSQGGKIPTLKSRFGTERNQAKAINFGIVFGKTPVSLAEDLGITPREAEELMDRWFATKPGVMRWMNRFRQEGFEEKRVLSLLGRWRNLPLLDKRIEPRYRYRSARAAINFGVQGSAADVVMAAMLRLWRDELLLGLGFHIVLQVHDEFVVEGPERHAQEAMARVEEVMRNPFWERSPHFKLHVPLRVDSTIAKAFG